MNFLKSVKAVFVWGIAAMIFVAVSAVANADGPADCKNIKTEKGTISGFLEEKNALCHYRGIPFAKPPVGELRFAPPADSDGWSGTMIADKFGKECLQNAMSLFPSDKIIGSEDCLYLNIYQPVTSAKEKKPVMIFYHGGGFMYGSGHEGLYQGTGLPDYGDVIYITANYRLGPFGFMVHPALKTADGIQGNYGIWDQLAALKWVKKNIASFGGDPDNITVFGESAGGMSVGLHLISPMFKGLFKRAIIESGPVLIIDKNVKESEAIGLAAAQKLGCGDPKTAAACLRGMDAEKLLRGAPAGIFFISNEESKANFPYSPAADGKLIPDYPYKMFKRGEFNRDASIMLGSNSDEATYFILSRKLDTPEDFKNTLATDAQMMKKAIGLEIDMNKLLSLYKVEDYPSPRKAYSDLFTDMAFTCTTRILADQMSAYKKDGIYLYYFSKKPVESGPFKEWGAFHGSELAFVFNKFDFMGIKFGSKKNSEMAKKMGPLWASFARAGKPVLAGAPEWPQYEPVSAPYYQLELDLRSGANLRTEKCQYFHEQFEKLFGTK